MIALDRVIRAASRHLNSVDPPLDASTQSGFFRQDLLWPAGQSQSSISDPGSWSIVHPSSEMSILNFITNQLKHAAVFYASPGCYFSIGHPMAEHAAIEPKLSST